MAKFCKSEGFRWLAGGVPVYDTEGSLKLLLSSHVGERDKALLRATLGFILSKMRVKKYLVGSMVGRIGMGTFFSSGTSEGEP